MSENTQSVIELRKLTIEERAVWGVCPVCEKKQGEPCASGMTHAARLVNAPRVAAVEVLE